MRLLTAAAACSTIAALALYAPASDACTNPERGADTPTVTGDTGTPTNGSTNTPGITESSSGTSGSTGATSSTGGTATPTSGEVALNSQFVEVSWTAGKEVDSDPNGSGYWSHGGHSLATRVEIKDPNTQQVVFQETVSQYNYSTVVKGSSNPTVLRTSTRLQPGEYEVRVQSVFSRHGEVRYGMDGTWQSGTAPVPAIKDSVPAAKIVITNASGDLGSVSGGCSASGGELMQGLSALALLLFSRRRSV